MRPSVITLTGLRLVPSTLGRAVALLSLAFPLPAAATHAQWTVSMRAMQNPLPLGQCTVIEVAVLDARGYPPTGADGHQVDWQDFELSFTAASPDAFAWRDERHRSLCAVAPTAASALVVARYPGRQVPPARLAPGLMLEQAVEVRMLGGPVAVASGAPAGPGYAGAMPASGADGGVPAGYASGGATAGYAGGPIPSPSTSPPPTQAAPTGMDPQAQPSVGPPGSPAATSLTPGTGGGQVRTGKQFVARISGLAKRIAGDVAVRTATDVADAAGEVVDTTLTAGRDLVITNARAAGTAVGRQVREAGSALTIGGDDRDPDDPGTVLAAGRVVLRHLRFSADGGAIDAAAAPALTRIASVMLATPAQFLIEAHVDGADAAAAQTLSDRRAVAVKAALIAAGVPPSQIVAVGYGATRPLGGPKSGGRIEIARTQ